MEHVLCGYEEVLAALHDPELSARCGQFAGSVESLAWPAGIEELARRLFGQLPSDLIAGFAQPWSLALAAGVTGISIEEAARLEPYAAQLFESTAADATLELARAFAGENCALKVQAFAALTQTLPAFLGNAWLALLENPAELALLRAHPQLLPNAIEELLRFAGPSQAIYRGTTTLLLAQANRDPAKFPEPDRLDLRRGASGHLAFGAGQHRCEGASLIRKAAAIATREFVKRNLQIAEPPELRISHPIRALRALKAVIASTSVPDTPQRQDRLPPAPKEQTPCPRPDPTAQA